MASTSSSLTPISHDSFNMFSNRAALLQHSLAWPAKPYIVGPACFIRFFSNILLCLCSSSCCLSRLHTRSFCICIVYAMMLQPPFSLATSFSPIGSGSSLISAFLDTLDWTCPLPFILHCPYTVTYLEN